MNEWAGYFAPISSNNSVSESLQAEEEMLTRFEQLNLDLMERSFTKQLLKTIIDESKRLQQEDRQLIAFQGRTWRLW